MDPNWNEFDIRTLSAESTSTDGTVIVSPGDNIVTITWPTSDNTETYSLVITKAGEEVCSLIFNAQGQLQTIAFKAPSANGVSHAPAAEWTTNGYRFTVTGLNPGTLYSYYITSTNAGGSTIAEYKGSFTTTGGASTSTNEVHGSQSMMHKYFHNGNLIIERNGIKYTPSGQKVK